MAEIIVFYNFLQFLGNLDFIAELKRYKRKTHIRSSLISLSNLFQFGHAGNIIALILFLSPLPTFMKIVKAKSVQAYRPDPYVATILNCGMWMFYSLPIVHPDSLLVFTINCAGFTIEIVFITIFLIYSTWGGRKKIIIVLVMEALFAAAVVVVTLMCFHTYASRSLVVGMVCVFFNILMYAAPLTVMVRK
ncbi:putative SWEET sugar transporter [Helianthus annuus]|nr:putative SWEET sugar transporter [Helianthus annuus]